MISLKKLLNYEKNFKIGKIKFPVKNSFNGESAVIDIKKVLKMIRGYVCDLDGLLFCIFLGSSVSIKKYNVLKYKRKKYIFFGKEIEKEKRKPVFANDIDILVVTKEKCFEKKYADKESCFVGDGSDVWVSVKSCGIDLINRTLDQLKESVKNKVDTISIDALTKGVVFIKNSNYDLNSIIKNVSPYKLYWDDNNMKLSGEIK